MERKEIGQRFFNGAINVDGHVYEVFSISVNMRNIVAGPRFTESLLERERWPSYSQRGAQMGKLAGFTQRSDIDAPVFHISRPFLWGYSSDPGHPSLNPEGTAARNGHATRCLPALTFFNVQRHHLRLTISFAQIFHVAYASINNRKQMALFSFANILLPEVNPLRQVSNVRYEKRILQVLK